jgi:hypothetical protein
VEGYLREYRKTQGLFCKNSRAGWVDLVDSRWTRSRSVGSRSDGCGCARVKRGSGVRSGPSDLDPAARIARERWPTAVAKRQPALSGGGVRRRRTLTRALVPDLARGRHLRAARGAAKPTGAAAAAETRWRGSETPARALGCYGAQAGQQATQARSSPPGAAIGQLHVEATAAETGNRRRRRKLGFRATAHDGGVAARARVRSPGGGTALNRPEGPPWRAGQGQPCVRAAAAGRTRGRVRPGHGRSGMTGGGHLSSAARGGGGEAGWRRWLAGPARPLGYWAATRGKSRPRLLLMLGWLEVMG